MNYVWDITNKTTYDNRIGQYKFSKEYEFIVKNGENLGGSILDIAGGSGRFAIPLVKFSSDITVIDINQEALAILSDRNSTIKVVHSDFMEAELSQKYMLITCIEAVGYFHDSPAFFSKIAEALAENGRFIFSCTNPLSWRFFLRKMKHLKNKSTHYNELTIKELYRILNEAGLKIVALDGFNWLPFPLSSNSILIPIFITIEKLFRLNRWHSQSPWLMISVKKTF